MTMIGRWTKRVEPVRSFSADMEAHSQVGRRHLGTAAVPVHRIVGSVGRAHELGSDFLPLRTLWGMSRTTPRYRWVKKAMAQTENSYLDEMHHVTGRYYSHGEYEAKRGAVLAPVELYKLRDVYYVLDGHHRVAAARSLGQVEIDAVVTEYLPTEETKPTS